MTRDQAVEEIMRTLAPLIPHDLRNLVRAALELAFTHGVVEELKLHIGKTKHMEMHL